MKIGMILNMPFPTDERVEKEAVSLVKAGHEVHLLCAAYSDEPLNEIYKDIKLTRFKINEKFNKKFLAAYLALPFYKIVWGKQIEKFVIDNNLDALHIHDLPLSDIGVKMKKKYGIKLICDQHEYYSEWIHKTAHYNTFIGKIVSMLSDWRKYEEKNLKQADLVITVEKPLEEEYLSNYTFLKEKIISIPNTPSSEVFNENNVDKKIVEKYKDNFVIVYIGNIDILRGLSCTINALPELSKKIPGIKLLLVGRCKKNYDPMAEAEKLGVKECIAFEGWQSVESLPSYIAASDVGIFTPPPNRAEINKTIATKNYQYLLMGKPAIVSEVKMMKEFVESNKVGFSVKHNDSKEFADVVTKLYEDKNLAISIKENCRKIAEKYVWEETVKPLIRAYNSF